MQKPTCCDRAGSEIGRFSSGQCLVTFPMDENENSFVELDTRGPIRPPIKKSAGVPGVVSTLTVIAVVMLLVLLMLPDSSHRDSHRRARCISHLKMIALALNNYLAVHKTFPPSYTTDADGKPLHSWRTLILPQLDQKALYDSIDLTKPWDDPVNAAAFKKAVDVYRCPSADVGRDNYTTYLAVVTPESCLRPGERRPSSDITDGLTLTLLVIEVDADHAVPWMAPTDADEELILSLGKKSRLHHAGGMPAVFVDASARFLPADLPADQRRALISIAGGDNAVIKALD
jgi:hypothetical protein